MEETGRMHGRAPVRLAARLAAVVLCVCASLLGGAGAALAAPPSLPPGEMPDVFGSPYRCGFYDSPAVQTNVSGVRRVYQVAYYLSGDGGQREAVLNVHESAGNFLDDQTGQTVQGRFIGTVVIGCGTR